ncbi:MAG: nitroreductase [Magnetovibrio sp.]|nr:nitroreductase [Magnetovibrio sp.]|tara:strand:+ start:2214 stop:2789 length:576 start_codon:yes stop_codon:yes gene_type:complete
MKQNLFIDFLKSRRSVTAKKMAQGKVAKKHLKLILEAGLRVPDHGALKPWRLVVITGAKRKEIDEKVIFSEYKNINPNASAELQEIERTRLQRADVVIAVISTPVEHKKITRWEMQLSAGAVCTTLLYAAQSLDYAAQWLTEWYSYNDQMLITLGGVPGKDQIAGFIYIGERVTIPFERTRPELETTVSYF